MTTDVKPKRPDGSPSRCQARVESILLNLCSIMWNADNLLLPAIYFQLARHYDASPSDLGLLTLMRGLSESLCALPSGFLADRLPRPALICSGCLLWAAGLSACALAPSFSWLVVFRTINGVGLGIVQPLLFSLVADKSRPEERGRAFGWLQFTGNTGQTIASAVATTLAGNMILGLYGWQFILLLVAFLSASTGFLIFGFVEETASRQSRDVRPVCDILREEIPTVCHIFCLPTFIVIIGQGIFGSAPWFAFSYLTLWLQLTCFTAVQAATIYAFFNAGCAIGGLLGGYMLDCVVRQFPRHGPLLLAQFSVIISLPLLSLILFGMGQDHEGNAAIVIVFCAVFLLTGSVIAWGQIINNKMFCDVVPAESYSHVYALDRCIEGAFGALGTPIVGILTDQVFKFNRKAANAGSCSPEDAAKLGNGVFAVSAVGFAVCFSFYMIAHWTYPRDCDNARRKAKQYAEAKSEESSEATSETYDE